MGRSDNNPLVGAYQDRIGVPSTGDEAYGYWVFVIGVLAAWFFLAFQAGNWSADFSSNEVMIIGVYGLGIFGIVLGSIFVPLLILVAVNS